jgi:hypothetical protein
LCRASFSKNAKIIRGPSQVTHNKNIMVGILLAEKAFLKSPYVKR